MNGFGPHVNPMVGLILLSWLGLRSLGMVRGAPPAAPGWPSGCTFPEVELPGGQSSQAAIILMCQSGFDGYHAIQKTRINGLMTPSESSTKGTRNCVWQRYCCHAFQLARVCWPCLRQRPSSLSIQTSNLPPKETSRSTFEKVLITRTWSVIGAY